jgi:hypothetical protein
METVRKLPKLVQRLITQASAITYGHAARMALENAREHCKELRKLSSAVEDPGASQEVKISFCLRSGALRASAQLAADFRKMKREFEAMCAQKPA